MIESRPGVIRPIEGIVRKRHQRNYQTKPPRDIVERCPERCAKDLDWHERDGEAQKQTHFKWE